MGRLLWFVLGGIATALGAGVAAVLTEGESGADEDSSEEKSPDCTDEPETEEV